MNGFAGWRDPDSNRGHHDFQTSARNLEPGEKPRQTSGLSTRPRNVLHAGVVPELALEELQQGGAAGGPRRAVLLGSVSAHVMHRAYCPVVVVPRGVDQGTVPVKAHQLKARSTLNGSSSMTAQATGAALGRAIATDH
jgi:hypothetical protein